ncbi:MAG: radical SAM protein [Nitrospira sp. NTP1]|nr:radical SAM protein [Nitrospira sp. NTP1]
MARLVKSGLIRLSFGLETVDPEIRRTMKKQVPLEHYVKANGICNQYGVEALNSVMIGLPGETRETVRATLKFLRQAREVKQANFAIAVPYPGTEFHKLAVNGEKGVKLMTQDFSEYRRYGSAVTTVGELFRALALDSHAAETRNDRRLTHAGPRGTPLVTKAVCRPRTGLTGATHQPRRWRVRSHTGISHEPTDRGSRSDRIEQHGSVVDHHVRLTSGRRAGRSFWSSHEPQWLASGAERSHDTTSTHESASPAAGVSNLEASSRVDVSGLFWSR